MALNTIATLPTAPARTMDSDAFNAAAEALAAALGTLVSDINTWSGQVPLQVSPANLNATSTTSVAVGTGSKSFTVETAKLFAVGAWLIVASTAIPSNYMVGQVASYNSGTGALVLSAQYSSGSGTIASWTVSPVAAPASNLTPRSVTAGTTIGAITPDSANADLYIVNGATGTISFAAPSGSPVDGQKLLLRFKDNGTSRSISSWNAIYNPYGTVSLPSATTIGKWHYVGLIYNAASSKWSAISHVVEQ